MPRPLITDVGYGFEEELDDLFRVSSQEITDTFLDDLSDHRLASKAPAGDWHKVCAVPVVVVEKWLREGFDIWRSTPREIVRRLRQEDLGKFIATTKSV